MHMSQLSDSQTWQLCVTFALTFVETHHDARIDSDTTFVSLRSLCCVLGLIVEKLLEIVVEIFAFCEINAKRGLASLCELTLSCHACSIILVLMHGIFGTSLSKRCDCHHN